MLSGDPYNLSFRHTGISGIAGHKLGRRSRDATRSKHLSGPLLPPSPFQQQEFFGQTLSGLVGHAIVPPTSLERRSSNPSSSNGNSGTYERSTKSSAIDTVNPFRREVWRLCFGCSKPTVLDSCSLFISSSLPSACRLLTLFTQAVQAAIPGRSLTCLMGQVKQEDLTFDQVQAFASDSQKRDHQQFCLLQRLIKPPQGTREAEDVRAVGDSATETAGVPKSLGFFKTVPQFVPSLRNCAVSVIGNF